MVFAKAGLTEVIKHLYYYQLCAYIQQTILKCPAFANTQTLAVIYDTSQFHSTSGTTSFFTMPQQK